MCDLFLPSKKEKRCFNSLISFLATCLFYLFLTLIISETFALYDDIEISSQNQFLTGSLDFYLNSTSSNFVPLKRTVSMEPGDSVEREISIIKNPKSNFFQYTIRTLKVGGDEEFCNALKLEASLREEVKYKDSLMNFKLENPILLDDNGKDDWKFIVTLPEGTNFAPGKICQIKFVFDGWQVNFSQFPQGFSDQEEIFSSFAVGGMKINKVYYDVCNKTDGSCGNYKGKEGENEWVEIFNPLDNPVDISGWQICDNFSCDEIPNSDPIPPKRFGILTGTSTTFEYWKVPENVVKIVIEDGKIGNGLSNDSDRVILKTPEGMEDDIVSWGEDNYAFDLPCSDIEEGHILGRVPNGFDTDLASDFKDLILPQVKVLVPNGGEVWWVGRTYTLEWEAKNFNGEDDELKIKIEYSADSGESWATIAKDTENDGAFDWRIPLFIGDYFVPSERGRIKVVAAGPENFMIQEKDISDKDFCPPIDYNALTEEEKASVDLLLTQGILSENEVIKEEIDTQTLLSVPATDTKNSTTSLNNFIDNFSTSTITTSTINIERASSTKDSNTSTADTFITNDTIDESMNEETKEKFLEASTSTESVFTEENLAPELVIPESKENLSMSNKNENANDNRNLSEEIEEDAN